MSIKKLLALRDQIAALVDEREQIAEAPLARTEIEAHVDSVLNAILSHPSSGPSPTGLRDGSVSSSELAGELNKPGVLIALFRPQITEYLLGIFDAEVGDDAVGLPAGERRQRLTELNGQIYQLEQQEDLLIEVLEEQGHDIARRPDANPRAALGLGEAA